MSMQMLAAVTGLGSLYDFYQFDLPEMGADAVAVGASNFGVQGRLGASAWFLGKGLYQALDHFTSFRIVEGLIEGGSAFASAAAIGVGFKGSVLNNARRASANHLIRNRHALVNARHDMRWAKYAGPQEYRKAVRASITATPIYADARRVGIKSATHHVAKKIGVAVKPIANEARGLWQSAAQAYRVA